MRTWPRRPSGHRLFTPSNKRARDAPFYQVESTSTIPWILFHKKNSFPFSPRRGRTRELWACNVVRVLPGRGVQAFSVPADVQPRPEGMGLLMFTQPARPTAQAEQPPMNKMP
jgi:hypothetical protein